jgi:hypothetical protein
MIIYVDIDETICRTPIDKNYSNCVPILENIEKINTLYDKGHTIVYWTARGSITKIDWEEITKKQFHQWGVKFHELKFGKPSYDIFICDKAINSLDFFKSQI